MDQSKKTMRHFYCRDVLWETFEQMANDFDCSIDYLVNEAMRYYARSKNYQSPGGPQMTQGAPVANNPNNTSGPTSYPGGPAKPPSGNNGMRAQPGTQPPPQQQPGAAAVAAAAARRAQPPTPGYQGPNNNNVNARGAGPAGGGPTPDGPLASPHQLREPSTVPL